MSPATLPRRFLLTAADLLDDPAELMIVDLRAARPRALLARLQPYRRDRWQLTDPTPERAPTAHELAMAQRACPTKAVVYIGEKPPSGDAEAALEALLVAPLRPLIVRVGDDGSLSLAGRVLDVIEADFDDLSGATRLSVRGETAAELRGIDLPAAVGLHGGRWVEVSGAHPYAELPGPTRFRLPPGTDIAPDGSRLVIDVVERSGRCRWSATLDVPGRAPLMLRSVRKVSEAPAPRDLIGLVLDRSCPDAQQWSAAREVCVGAGGGEIDRFALDADATGATECDDYRSFNKEIRSALAEVLRAALPEEAELHVWAVNDVADAHLGAPPGVTLPLTCLTPCGSGRSSEAAELLRPGGWTPGLDVFDPLEIGVAAALDELAAHPGRHAAIVIVGNSPPTPSMTHGDPYVEVAAALGPVTAVRSRSRAWRRALERARTMGVPVIYVFLEQRLSHATAVMGPEEEKDHGHAQVVQAAVRKALSKDLKVIAVPADRQGVIDGVARALAVAASGPRQAGSRVGPQVSLPLPSPRTEAST